ncbi:MAG: hypothetical protein J3R72DRAFT_463442 [Linnemannia gamsii]|nr:MAG: hypothetical protein J3R72DRAFT_463442 [Linnemannia gamsii]
MPRRPRVLLALNPAVAPRAAPPATATSSLASTTPTAASQPSHPTLHPTETETDTMDTQRGMAAYPRCSLVEMALHRLHLRSRVTVSDIARITEEEGGEEWHLWQKRTCHHPISLNSISIINNSNNNIQRSTLHNNQHLRRTTANVYNGCSRHAGRCL